MTTPLPLARSPSHAVVALRSAIGILLPPNEWVSVVVDDAVDQAVLERFVRLEEAVALHVVMNTLERLPGVLRVDLVDPPTDIENLPRVDLDVGRLPLESDRGLMGEDAAVREGQALAFGASGQHARSHRHRAADAGRVGFGL